MFDSSSLRENEFLLHLSFSFSLFIFASVENIPFKSYSMHLLGLGFVLFLLFKQLKRREQIIKKLVTNRSVWLYQQLLTLYQSTEPSISDKWYLEQKTNTPEINQYGRLELGINSISLNEIRLSPDIEYAETELVKSEEKASILIGITVFLPVIFALFHLFQAVNLVLFLFSLQITFILGELAVLSQQRAYQIDGWEESFNVLDQLISKITVKGRQVFNDLPSLIETPLSNELGIKNKVRNSSPAVLATGTAINAITQLPPDQRKKALQIYLSEIRELPKQEKLLKTRWDAYQSRVVLITTTGIAVSGLLASISSYAIPTLSNDFMVFESTTYLPIGLSILSIGLSWLVISSWFTWYDQLKWVFLWILVYSFIYLISSAIYV